MYKSRLNNIFLFAAALLIMVSSPLALGQSTQTRTFVRMETVLGDIDIELYNDITPLTVANFVENYVNEGKYNNSFIHRSVPDFIIQGGGFKVRDNAIYNVGQYPPVVNEFNLSNKRGTIAMAKLGGDPDSATNQWFFSLDDNAANLDNQNGGFTVFGRVIGDGMIVVDAIAALLIYDFSNIHSAWSDLPLIDYQEPDQLALENLVLLPQVSVVTGLESDIPGPYEGNYDLDDDVDLMDFAVFAAAWATVQGDTRYNPACDHYFDGTIDERDLFVFASNWYDE